MKFTICSLIVLNSLRVFSQAGMLDPSFGVGGKVIMDIDNRDNMSERMLLMPDGRILVCSSEKIIGGTYSARVIFTMFDASGAPDPSFGIAGIVSTAVTFNIEEIQKVILLSDGKILVGVLSTANQGFVYRFNADGTIDLTFGTSGYVVAAYYVPGQIAVSGLFQTSADTLFGVYSYHIDGDFAIDNDWPKILRYNYNADDPYQEYALYYIGQSFPVDALMQPDKKIVILSNNSTTYQVRIIISRSDPINHQTLDYGFGYMGAAYNEFAPGTSDRVDAKALAIQDDGKILAAGTAYQTGVALSRDFVIVRYNTNGIIDSTFGGDGIVYTTITVFDDYVTNILVTPENKIVVCGYTTATAGNSDIILVQYNSDGSLDETFGDAGKIILDLSGYDDEIYSIAIKPEGILVAGKSYNPVTGYDITLARFIADNNCSIAPAGIYADGITPYKAKLHWADYPGADKYRIAYKKTTSPVWTTVSSLSNFKKLTGLEPGSTYEYKIKAICEPGESGPYSDIYYFSTPAKEASGDFAGDMELVIYPNPAASDVFVLCDAAITSFTITDLLGRPVDVNYDFNGTETHLEVGGLPAGIYLLTVTTEQGSIAEKIIIQ